MIQREWRCAYSLEEVVKYLALLPVLKCQVKIVWIYIVKKILIG